MSRWDRLLVFGACNVAALACFVLCFALFPILWPVPRKFAILCVYPVLCREPCSPPYASSEKKTRHPRHHYTSVMLRKRSDMDHSPQHGTGRCMMRLEARSTASEARRCFDGPRVLFQGVVSHLHFNEYEFKSLTLTSHLLCRWTFGSVLFLASWAVLMGPITYTKHLVSGPRLPFTAIYFGSIFMTLFSAMSVRSPCTPTAHTDIESIPSFLVPH